MSDSKQPGTRGESSDGRGRPAAKAKAQAQAGRASGRAGSAAALDTKRARNNPDAVRTRGSSGRPVAGARPGRSAGPTQAGRSRGGPSGRGGVPAGNPRRFSSTTMAIGAVLVVVVVVAVMVIVKVTGSSTGTSTPGGGGATSSPAPVAMVKAATSVPASVADAVGLPSSVSPPRVLSGQPLLTVSGKPAVFYVGAEYCPYCAAERWAVVVALSRFGTFSGLRETHSSTTDVYPDTVTFSFYGSSYSSPYLVFDPTEMYTNQPASNGSGYQTLQPLVGEAKTVFYKYDAPPYVPAGSQGAFPFVDIGNRVLVSGASYSPQVLQGLTDLQIAKDLSNPTSPVTQAIAGTANYLTAAICAITSGKPASVCQEPYVTKAAHAMKLAVS